MGRLPLNRRTTRRLIQVLLAVVLWITAVFASAGQVDRERGWICVTAYVIGMMAAGLLVRRKNPTLMEARANWRRKDTKRFDKFFLSIYLPLTLVQPIIAGPDSVRFHWSSMGLSSVYAGLILFAVAMTLITCVMMVNPHAESTVRIQTDRDHKTVTSGPYQIVRHPMYLGEMLLYPAIALIFGLLWALAVSAGIAILFIWRTALEDRTLRGELPGYEEFASVPRFRLLPGLW